jgi:hypothetical protein
MNALIDNIEILNTYYEIQHKPQSYSQSYKEIFDLFPKVIKSIIETDEYIQPKHLTQELLKTILTRQCTKIESRFKNDSHCEPVIDTICLYLREDPAFLTIGKGFSFDKGLLLRGKVGSGKTLIMRAIDNLLNKFAYKDYSSYQTFDISFRMIESWKISEEFMKGGFERLETMEFVQKYAALKRDSICIDDIGSEQIPTNYGNTVNIIGEILMRRYSFYKEENPANYRTHATSNLDVTNLKMFYGERVFSRMKEMFNDIILTGNDRRK